MSLFLKYKQDKCVKGYTDQTGSTHTSMRGGFLTVPVDIRAQFLDDYFAAFKRGEMLAWCKRVPTSDPFRFLIDFDFAHGDEFVPIGTMQDDLVEIVCSLCDGKSTEAIEKLPWSCCFGSRCPNKLHAHFPNLVVDRKTAKSVGQKIIALLKKKYPNIKAWNKIVDLTIYKGGMRLLRLRKSQKAEDKEQKEEEERLGKENMWEIPLTYKMTLPDGTQVDLERSHLDLCTILVEPGTHLTPLPGLYIEGEDGADGEESDEETVVEQPKKIRKKATKVRAESEGEDEEEDGAVRIDIPKDVRRELAIATGIDDKHLRYGKMGENSIEIVTHANDCPFSESGGHKSNHQRLFVSANSVVRKCHSKKCSRKKRGYTCPRASEWFLSFFRAEMEAPGLDKNAILRLYNPDGKSYNQPPLTEYLNRFIAFIQQNDSYGIRMRDDMPFDICKKSTAYNKMERFETKSSPFNVWCTNVNRKEFFEVVFDTSDKIYPATTLNLFRGYKAKLMDRKIEAEEIETFLYHLREVCCRGAEKNFDYYLRWWAWFFQKGRTGVMVILVSKEKGTGKNIILELLQEYIIGDCYCATTDKIDTIVQRFNGIMVEKALIVANELKDASKNSRENGRVEEVLKTLIKDRKTAIEKKGIDPISVPSMTNFHGTANYLVPLKIDQDQRRYFVLEVSTCKKGDKAYFGGLAEFVKTRADEIFTYLNQVDLTGWHPEFDLVQTEFTKRVQRAFVTPAYEFWGDSAWARHDFDKHPVKKLDVFKQYLGWCTENKWEARDSGWFGREVAAMGYTMKQQQIDGLRERIITGKLSDKARILMGV